MILLIFLKTSFFQHYFIKKNLFSRSKPSLFLPTQYQHSLHFVLSACDLSAISCLSHRFRCLSNQRKNKHIFSRLALGFLSFRRFNSNLTYGKQVIYLQCGYETISSIFILFICDSAFLILPSKCKISFKVSNLKIYVSIEFT